MKDGNAQNQPLSTTTKTTTLTLSKFPPFKRNRKQDIACQIAQHLALLLKNDCPHSTVELRIPATTALSQFYNCTVLDVLDGLYAFKQKNHEYVMSGLDSEIILCAQPHFQKTRTQSPWLTPWDMTHRIAENPFINLFPGKAG